MVHDQLAAAGYQTIFDTDVSVEQLLAKVDRQTPQLIVLGGTVSTTVSSVERAVKNLRASHPDIPIMLRGAALGRGLLDGQPGTRVLERIDESVKAAEEMLAAPVPVPSM
jgi:cobalamin-dependent methionine synthase I